MALFARQADNSISPRRCRSYEITRNARAKLGERARDELRACLPTRVARDHQPLQIGGTCFASDSCFALASSLSRHLSLAPALSLSLAGNLRVLYEHLGARACSCNDFLFSALVSLISVTHLNLCGSLAGALLVQWHPFGKFLCI